MDVGWMLMVFESVLNVLKAVVGVDNPCCAKGLVLLT